MLKSIIDNRRTSITTTNNNNGSNDLDEEKDQYKEGCNNHKDLISLLLQSETDAFISPINEEMWPPFFLQVMKP